MRELLRGKGDFICGAVTAVRRDHVLVGSTHGVASLAVPFDYLVMATGSSYQSEIKSEGTTIEHRKEALSTERQRFAQNESLTCVGGGLVGIEYAFDLQVGLDSPFTPEPEP